MSPLSSANVSPYYYFINLCFYLTPFLSYSASNYGVTVKSGLQVIQGHWKWHHSIECKSVPIGVR